MNVEKIVSGAQTGVDRAALDVALELGLAVGGWIPKGRRAEDGPIPARYRSLTETDSDDYAQRTEWNVRDSDATLVITSGVPTGGAALTIDLAYFQGKPLLVLDLSEDPAPAAARLRQWLQQLQPQVLNVAGPRQQEAPELGAAAQELLKAVLTELCS